MTNYLLAVHAVAGEPQPTPEEMEQAYRQVDAFNAELQYSGSWVFAGGLEPPATARVVRVEAGEVRTSEGPFALTREQLGGFWIIDVPTLDAALGWAAKATAACMAPVEVRAFQAAGDGEG